MPLIVNTMDSDRVTLLITGLDRVILGQASFNNNENHVLAVALCTGIGFHWLIRRCLSTRTRLKQSKANDANDQAGKFKNLMKL
jgi:hypothetical protein